MTVLHDDDERDIHMTEAVAAYGVYRYGEDPAGMSGRIVDEGGTTVSASPNMDTMGPDPQVEGFVNPSDVPLICSTERVTSGTPSNKIFSVAGSQLATPSWPDIANLYGIVSVGSYLYALDYDNARVVEIDPSTYAETKTEPYTYETSHAGYTGRGQALLVVDGTLYGLFAVPSDDWTEYEASALVKFDITGGSSIDAVETNDTDLAGNAFAMAYSDGYIYVASIGGEQTNTGPNEGSALQKVEVDDLSSVDLVMAYDDYYTSEFRDISFDGSTAYILKGNYNGSWQLAGKLLKTTDFSSFTVVNDFTGGADGYCWAAQYVPDNDRVWFARGNQVLLYAASGPTLNKTLSMSELGSAYTNLDALSYVGVVPAAKRAPGRGLPRPIRGYRSPVQASRTQRGIVARQIAEGRPSLTKQELRQLDERLARG